jgi:hypothetical protein
VGPAVVVAVLAVLGVVAVVVVLGFVDLAVFGVVFVVVAGVAWAWLTAATINRLAVRMIFFMILGVLVRKKRIPP